MLRIIAFQACRHGTGCSHLVANLAVLLMQAGYRIGLLDTDPRSGGIRTLFGLENASTAGPQSYWWLRLDPDNPQKLKAQTQVYGTPFPQQQTGIYLPSEHHQGKISQQLANLQQYYGGTTPSEALTHLSQDLRLDYLLLDTQPTLDDENLLSLALADTMAILLQLDNYDFQRIAVLLGITQKLNIQNAWLIPSQVLPMIAEIESVAAQLNQTYQLPVGAVLPLSEDVVRLASGGLFCLHYPQHALTKVMMGFAQKLSQASLPISKSTEPARQRRRGQALIGILDLPPLNQQVLTAIIRQGGLSTHELVDQGLGSITTVSATLNDLERRGWLTHDAKSNVWRYQNPHDGND